MSSVQSPRRDARPTAEPPRSPNLFQRYRQLSLGVRILIFMVLGVIAGLVAGERAMIVQPIGDLFIRLLLLVAVPLIFFNLIAGVGSLSDVGALGRLGGKLFLVFAVSIGSALPLGILAVHLIQPGANLEIRAAPLSEVGAPAGAVDILLDLVPANIFDAFVQGNVAQIVVFAVLAGVATLLLPEQKRERFQAASDMLAELLRKMVDLVMLLGPLGIGALAAAAVGQFGSEVFGPLSLFIAGVVLAQLAMVGILMVMLRTLGCESPLDFLKRTAPLYATTSATCSSLASLAVSYKMAEDRLHIPRTIYAFVLPLGAQLNKPGTCIMLTGVLVFTTQAAGIPFTGSMVLPAILLGALMSAGSGGIPGGGLVMALIYVQAFGLPVEIAALVGGIYRIIDMGNTTLNIGADLVGAQILARSERVPAAASRGIPGGRDHDRASGDPPGTPVARTSCATSSPAVASSCLPAPTSARNLAFPTTVARSPSSIAARRVPTISRRRRSMARSAPGSHRTEAPYRSCRRLRDVACNGSDAAHMKTPAVSVAWLIAGSCALADAVVITTARSASAASRIVRAVPRPCRSGSEFCMLPPLGSHQNRRRVLAAACGGLGVLLAFHPIYTGLRTRPSHPSASCTMTSPPGTAPTTNPLQMTSTIAGISNKYTRCVDTPFRRSSSIPTPGKITTAGIPSIAVAC